MPDKTREEILLQEIDEFLKERDRKYDWFMKKIKNGRLIHQLTTEGCEVRRSTVEKVRAFIEANRKNLEKIE